MGSSDENASQTNSALLQTPALFRMLKMIKFVRMLRIIRVFKLKKLIYKLEEYVIADHISMIMEACKLGITILYISHWLACTFYFIGDFEAGVEPSSWTIQSGLQDQTAKAKYIASLYWAFSTMATVGYGDLIAVTNNEKIFIIIGMIISCGMFSYSIGAIGTIVNKPNIMVQEFKTKILHIT